MFDNTILLFIVLNVFVNLRNIFYVYATKKTTESIRDGTCAVYAFNCNVLTIQNKTACMNII